MRKKIILHMGAHKTGTTTIQKTFFANRDKLRANGIEYVGIDTHDLYLFAYFYRNFSDPHHFLGLTPEEAERRANVRIAEVRKQIEESPCETVIVSTEHFCLLPPAGIRDLNAYMRELGDVRAVYYYRELLSWMESDTQQVAKTGHNIYPTQYKVAVARLYRIPLDISRLMGRENTTFIKFEHAVKEGITNSLLKAFDLPVLEKMGIEEITGNVGISGTAVRAFFIYNRLFPRGSEGRSKAMVQRIMRLSGEKYRITGLAEGQIADYALKRAEVEEKLGLQLQPADTIPESPRLDMFNAVMQDILTEHLKKDE